MDFLTQDAAAMIGMMYEDRDQLKDGHKAELERIHAKMAGAGVEALTALELFWLSTVWAGFCSSPPSVMPNPVGFQSLGDVVSRAMGAMPTPGGFEVHPYDGKPVVMQVTRIDQDNIGTHPTEMLRGALSMISAGRPSHMSEDELKETPIYKAITSELERRENGGSPSKAMN